MQFADPKFLNLLWLLPAFIVMFSVLNKRREKKLNAFIEKHLVGDLIVGKESQRMMLRQALLLVIFIFSVLALARPQWGFRWQEIKREGLDIIVAVDVSKSMLTQDVKPNRLERTKLAIKDLLSQLKGDRIGLMAFAGDAFLMCPLTVDYSGFMLSLNDLGVSSVPRGGTNISKAIDEAMKSYEKIPSRYRSIIIVTDGEDLEGDSLKSAQKAKEQGVKLYTVGVGTQEGELIQVEGDDGTKDFLKDSSGNYVKSRLNEKLLQEIALSTGGIYVKSSGAQFGLDYIYDNALSKSDKRETQAAKQKEYFERFQFPLALAALLLVIETCLGVRRKQ
jgi:Ca-activated chloride channel family protein